MACELKSAKNSVSANYSGHIRMTLMGVLACSLLVFGFLLLLKSPAQAWTTKYASCSSSACHAAAATASPAAVLSVAINGTAGNSVNVSAGSTFEIDWMFTNMVYNAKYTGTAPEVAVPTGWTLQSGTANSPSLTGWSSAWDLADGVGWATANSYSTAAEFPNSPVGYTINFNGSSWDNGNRNCALDDGSTGDLDGVANKMGTDARITVPAGTAAGTYTVMLTGIGHNESDTKSHIEQAITVNVVPVVTSTSPNSMAQGTGPSTVTINGASFTNTGLSVTFSGTGVTAGTATYVSATQITVPVTVAAGAAIGARNVTVTCSGQSGTGTGVFSVTAGLTATTTSLSNPAAITYGQSASFTATVAPAAATGTVQFKVDGANVGSPVTLSSGTATLSGVNGLAAGSRSVTAVYSGDANYAASTASAVTQTVNAKPVTVTAAAKSKVYGAADPALTFTVNTGDTLSGSLTRAAGENIGNYAIQQGTVTNTTNPNFSITYVGANLTITAKPVTVTAAAKSKVYGAADPALTFTVNTGDTLSGSLTRAAGENVGNYAIQQGTVTNATNPNFSITYAGANLTITAKPVTVTAAAKSKVYGAVDPALTYTVNTGDTLTGSLTRATGENVGDYAIQQGTVTNANNPNFSITYVGANLTITAKPVTVTAATKSKVYGAADPALTYTVNTGDTLSGSLTRDAGENTGDYAIQQGTVTNITNSNFSITYVGANLSITPATLTVTAEPRSKIYGESDPALTYNASGFVNSDTVAIMSGSLSRAAGTTIGSYVINQGTLSAGSNYTISYTGANLDITAAALTVTANNQSKTYGSTFTFAGTEFSTTGLVGGDTVSSVTLSSAGAAAAAAVSGSPYLITPSAATGTGLGNYTISYVNGQLTVNMATLTVTVADQSRAYGSDNPALTFAYSGFVNSENASHLTTEPTAATAAIPLSPVGLYPITASGGVSSNYTFNYLAGTLTVSKADQTIGPITFTPDALAVGGTTTVSANATSGLTVSYSSTTESVCTVTGGSTVNGISAGTCTITANQAGDGNYNAAPGVNQNLTVTGGSTDITLTVTTAGAGSGTLISSPGSINCSRDNNLESGVCSGIFTNPTSDVTLTAAPDWKTEVIWSGGCTASGNECGPFTLSSDTGVTATFNYKQLVMMPGPVYYATIQDAYNAAAEGAVIRGRDQTFTENLVFDRTVNVTFNGGNGAAWTVAENANTTINGTVTIAGNSGGGVTISNLLIQ